MKNFIILILIVFLLSSCTVGSYLNIPEFKTVGEAQKWIVENIEYATDKDQYGQEDYWATPEETILHRKGDCEDMAILFMYIVKYQFNLNPYLEIVQRNDYLYHAIIKINNQLYDSTSALTGSNIEYKNFQYELNYDTAMWRAQYCHK